MSQSSPTQPPLFDQCGVMPIQTRVKFSTVTMVYKTLKGLNPPYMFKSVSEVSSQLTRSSKLNKLYVPWKDVCVSRLLRYSGAVFYNTLGNIIRDSQSVASFKYKVFKHFM